MSLSSTAVTFATWIFVPIFIGVFLYLLWVGLIRDTIKLIRDKKKRLCSKCNKKVEAGDIFCKYCGSTFA